MGQSSPSGRLVAAAVPCLALAAALLAQGCAVLAGRDTAGDPGDLRLPAMVWPVPPAAPRIRYVGQLTGRADFERRRSAWRRVFDFVVGLRAKDDAFAKPLSVDVDDNDNICVADTGAKAVFICNRERSLFKCFRRLGDTTLVSPVASVAGGHDTFLVADSALGQVLAFDLNGRLLFALADGLERPSGLAVFGERIFVADSKRHQILIFDFQGRQVSSIGERGSGPGQFNCPTHVTIDRNGRLYVTDSMNFRIQAFDASGRFLGAIGEQGDTSGRFSRPKGTGVDAFGHVYVADGLFDNIQVFDPGGRFLLNWGTAGSEEGEFWLPTDVAVSKQNAIYVADSYNKRVQVFQYVGDE